MFTDDSRGLESPDRFDASTTTTRVRTDGGTPSESIRERLEALDHLTRMLHADVQTEATALEGVDDDTRRKTARRIREIRATVGQVGLELFGPESSIPSRQPTEPSERACRDGSVVTTYSGPAPGAFERERDARREHDRDERGEADRDVQTNGQDGVRRADAESNADERGDRDA